MDQPGSQEEAPHSNQPSQSMYYEIRVLGLLDRTWSDWFNGLVVIPQENGQTLIAGPIPDQASLQGILTKLFNMRLTLISVTRIE